MRKGVKSLLKWLVIILPIILAVIVVAYLVTHRPGPSRKQGEESIKTLRIIEVPSVDLVPRSVGYGAAEPGEIWEAIAEVKGAVTSIHPRLKSGELIEAKSELIQIDPTEYELAVARLEAGIKETQAKIEELAAEEENARKLLEVERRSLELTAKSLERKMELLESSAISKDDVDREEVKFLQQKQKVVNLENSLALIPFKRKSLDAAVAVHESNLKQAKNDLAKTTITAPFDCRLGEVNIEIEQFVGAGQRLFKAYGTAFTNVEARFRIEELRHLLGERKRSRLQPGLSTGSFKQLFEDIRVIITLESGDWSAEWEARIDRLRETMDVKTREIRVVTVVDRPYEKASPGIRPPLMAGMFCQVELRAPSRPGSIVAPRSAIHDNSVFVIDQEQRLQKKPVEVDFVASDFVVIESGLSEGEMLVVSDPAPAIVGMKVSAVSDDSLKQYLLEISQGERAK